MKDLKTLFCAYAEDHQNEFNQKVHLYCVPLIVYSLMGLLWSFSPVSLMGLNVNLAIAFAAIIGVYYFFLSFRLAVITISATALFFLSFYYIEKAGLPLLYISIVIFMLAWIGQFYGHKVEGKKPSFLTDLTYLFIGPLWVIEKILGHEKKYKA